jgi:hypothetical protein
VTGTRAAHADGDQDGLPLLLEYAFNLSPVHTDLPPAAAADPEPFGVPQRLAPGQPSEGFLTYVRVKNDPWLTASVKWSRELDAWSPVSPAAGEPVVVDVGTTHELVKSPAPGGNGVPWWRVKAVYQAD